MDHTMTDLPLQQEEYTRYGRQMILPEIGLAGQLRLRSASVLVIGAGGLGCPLLTNLVAAGVGNLTIVDDDVVQLSNLMRQNLHSVDRIGLNKALSAKKSLQVLNPLVHITTVTDRLHAHNAAALFTNQDLVVDCTDNVAIRYLISDAAVHFEIPMISAAAIAFNGQLATYNARCPTEKDSGKRGPCYRCVHPVPPPPETVGSCAEVGVLGCTTSIIGSLQAMEVVKVLLGQQDNEPHMTLYSSFSGTPFRRMRMRDRKPTCLACGDLHSVNFAAYDYEAFVGQAACSLIIKKDDHRIDIQALRLATESVDAVVIDTRPSTEFKIACLPGTSNIPLREILRNPQSIVDAHQKKQIILVCRKGNDSYVAAEALRKCNSSCNIQDVTGGIDAWRKEIDSSFPDY